MSGDAHYSIGHNLHSSLTWENCLVRVGSRKCRGMFSCIHEKPNYSTIWHNDGFSACLLQKFCKSVVIYQYLIMHLETGVTESSSEQNFAPSFSLRVTLASLWIRIPIRIHTIKNNIKKARLTDKNSSYWFRTFFTFFLKTIFDSFFSLKNWWMMMQSC